MAEIPAHEQTEKDLDAKEKAVQAAITKTKADGKHG